MVASYVKRKALAETLGLFCGVGGTNGAEGDMDAQKLSACHP